MRILDVRECSVPISRFADPALPGGGLTTSIVAVATDARRDGAPVVGYGFASFGRFAQGGLIRERFAPRLLAAGGGLDPFRAWEAMMEGEKPGGHGERCVAVGALDMALWDASARRPGCRCTVIWRRSCLRRDRSPTSPSTRRAAIATPSTI